MLWGNVITLLDIVEKIGSNKATVCVLGLGRVGLPLSVVLANSGLNVIGVDIDREKVIKISRGEAPFRENKLEESLRRALESKKFEATTESIRGLARADIILVTVGTPITTQYYMDYSQLHGALEEILGGSLAMKAIGFRCTLIPGTLSNLVIPFLEEKSGLKAGVDFALAMCPERILEGHAIEELYRLPEIVGGVNDVSNAIFTELFKKINPKKAILHTTPTGAELAKLFTNIYRYVNFALANEFAIWAEMYGEDAHEIIKVANYDYPRCNIPKPGFAGGPCLGKDGFLLDNNTTFSSIISTAWKLNEAVPQHVVESLRRKIGQLYGKRISVLGLAYKAESDDTRLSSCVKLVEILKGYGATVLVHDPYVPNTLSIDKVLENPDLVIIAVDHPEFSQLAKRIDDSGCGLVYDVWGVFDPADFQRASYMRFGRAR
jgi:UDP-N-acetyl-D-mannosaminuronic acid dehydrogenase